MQDNNLSDKQLKFIDAYFKEQDINTICSTLNITRPTYYSYINNSDVKQEIDKIRYQMLNDTTNYLQNNLRECSKVLMDIIKSDNTPLQTKINAINSIFNNSCKLTEQVDLYNKMQEIESKLKEYDSQLNREGLN